MMNGLLCGMFMHMKSNNRNSREVVEHRTKSLKPALGAWSNVIQEVTISIYLRSQQFVASMSNLQLMWPVLAGGCALLGQTRLQCQDVLILKSGKSQFVICEMLN